MRFLTGDDTGLMKIIDSDTAKILQTVGVQEKVHGITNIKHFDETMSSLKIIGDVDEKNDKAAAKESKEIESKSNSDYGCVLLTRENGLVELYKKLHDCTQSCKTSCEEEKEKKEKDSNKANNKASDAIIIEKEKENDKSEAPLQSASASKDFPPLFTQDADITIELDLEFNIKDLKKKSEKLILADRMRNGKDLIVLSSLGKVWIVEDFFDVKKYQERQERERQEWKKQKKKEKENDSEEEDSDEVSNSDDEMDDFPPLQPTFQLQGTYIYPNDEKYECSIKDRSCISCAVYHPRKHQLCYAGIDNELKIYSFLTNSIVWKAKNLPNDHLDLSIPVKYSRIHWGHSLVPDLNDDVIIAITKNGKIRIYDPLNTVSTNNRPLFEYPIVFRRERSSGYAGAAASNIEANRPIMSSVIQDGVLICGDTVGNVEMFSLVGARKYLSRLSGEEGAADFPIEDGAIVTEKKSNEKNQKNNSQTQTQNNLSLPISKSHNFKFREDEEAAMKLSKTAKKKLKRARKEVERAEKEAEEAAAEEKNKDENGNESCDSGDKKLGVVCQADRLPIDILHKDNRKQAEINLRSVPSVGTRSRAIKVGSTTTSKNTKTKKASSGPSNLNHTHHVSKFAHYDYVRNNKIIRYFGSFPSTGSSIRGMCHHPTKNFLVSVGLGRFATVFKCCGKTGKRRVEKRIYLKQKLNCCCVITEGDEEEDIDEEDEEEGSDNDVEEVDDEASESGESDKSTNAEEDDDADLDGSVEDGDEESDSEAESDVEEDVPVKSKTLKSDGKKSKIPESESTKKPKKSTPTPTKVDVIENVSESESVDLDSDDDDGDDSENKVTAVPPKKKQKTNSKSSKPNVGKSNKSKKQVNKKR